MALGSDDVVILKPEAPPGAISLTVVPPSLATQTWVPSDETPLGLMIPELLSMVWMTEPVEAFNSVTVSFEKLVTQTCVPSDEMPVLPPLRVMV